MTEAEWLACEEFIELLNAVEGRGSDRRWRLLACAAVRTVWGLLTEPACRTALETAELFADRQADRDTASAIKAVAERVAWPEQLGTSPSTADYVATQALITDEGEWCEPTATWCVGMVREVIVAPGEPEHGWQRALCQVIRDVFACPFESSVTIRTNGLNWRDGSVTSLARAAYDERLLPSGELDLQRLAVLADALEEAGGADAELLAHLRGPGPHVRGCWELDLVLGKS